MTSCPICYVGGIAIDDVRREVDPGVLGQRNIGDHVRRIEVRQPAVGIHREADDRAAARHRGGLRRPAPAVGADGNRWVDQLAAVAALLNAEDAVGAGGPEPLVGRGQLRERAHQRALLRPAAMPGPSVRLRACIDIDVAIEHVAHATWPTDGGGAWTRRRGCTPAPRANELGDLQFLTLQEGLEHPLFDARRKIPRSCLQPRQQSETPDSGVRHIGHWVAGRAVPGTSGRTAPVYDPAKGAQTAEVALAHRTRWTRWSRPRSGRPHEWRSSSLTRRASLLFRLRELLDASRDELAAAVTREHGKVLEDARGEVARWHRKRRVRLRHPQPAEGIIQFGDLDGDRHPYGARAAGSRRRHHPVQLPDHGAVVDDGQRHCLRQLLRAEAVRKGPLRLSRSGRHRPTSRLPRRRLQRGAGRSRGGRVAARPPGCGGDFVRRQHAGGAPHLRDRDTPRKRVQALGGAKNHMVVLPDADLDAAADAAVSAAYGSAGERCMAISVVVAVGPVGEPLVDAIASTDSRHRGRRR